METTKHLTGDSVNFDDEREVAAFDEEVMTAGMKRVCAHRATLRAKGLMDADGNLTVSELPPDMREGSDRDFGG